MSAWTGAACVLGKVPWRDEFLRPTGPSSELRLLDEWLFRNAHAAAPALADAARGGGILTYGFLMRVSQADSQRAVAGVVCPSRDRAGRAYPLAVAAPLALERDLGRHPEVAPILLEGYWQQAIDVLGTVSLGPFPADDRSLEQIVQTPPDSVASALAFYTQWARETSVCDLCAQLERPFDWLIGVTNAVADRATRRVSPREVHSVRLPLGRAAGSAVCFWLDVQRRANDWRDRAPTFFWSHDGDVGDVLLCTRDAGDSTLAALWQRDGAHVHVWDLVQQDPETPGLPSGAGDDRSVAALLEHIGQPIGFSA
jgi:type VI secretion system ImpM family protein